MINNICQDNKIYDFEDSNNRERIDLLKKEFLDFKQYLNDLYNNTKYKPIFINYDDEKFYIDEQYHINKELIIEDYSKYSQILINAIFETFAYYSIYGDNGVSTKSIKQFYINLDYFKRTNQRKDNILILSYPVLYSNVGLYRQAFFIKKDDNKLYLYNDLRNGADSWVGGGYPYGKPTTSSNLQSYLRIVSIYAKE